MDGEGENKTERRLTRFSMSIPEASAFPIHSHSIRSAHFTFNFKKVARKLLDCKVLLTTSLHGIVFADAFGVPVAWLRNSSLPSGEEGMLKYRDYIAASRRKAEPVHVLGDISVTLPPLPRSMLLHLWRGLLDSFPFHRMCEGADMIIARARMHALIDDFARQRGWE